MKDLVRGLGRDVDDKILCRHVEHCEVCRTITENIEEARQEIDQK